MNNEKIATEIVTGNEINRILSLGVRNMPQNPASCGYTADQIRAFYYRTEEEILKLIAKLEELNIKKFGIFDDEIIALKAYKGELANAFEDYVENTNNEINNKLEEFTETIAETIAKVEEQIQIFIADTNKKVDKKTADITKNTNNIKALFNLQLDKNVLVYENAELTEQVQKTGGADLEGLTILDNSYCTVNKVSGASVAGKNLLNPSRLRATQTINGVTFTNNGDGTITVNGTATAEAAFHIMNATTYYFESYWFSGCPSGGSKSTYFMMERTYGRTDIGDGMDARDTKTHNLAIVIASGYTANNLVFKPTISYDSAIPYADFEKYPFWAGFKNAQFKGIKSTGRNLVNIEPQEVYVGFRAKTWKVNIQAPCRISWKENFSSIKTPNAALFAFVVDGKEIYAAPAGYLAKGINSGHLTEIKLLNGCVAVGTVSDIMVHHWDGTTATDYEPYTESVMELPETVELGAYDYIDFERQKIVRQTGKKVFTGEGGEWVGDGSWSGGATGTGGWGGTKTCGFYVYIDGTNGDPNLDIDLGAIDATQNDYAGTFLSTPIKQFKWAGNDKDNVGVYFGWQYIAVRVSRSTLTAYGSDNSSASANITAFKAYLADLYAKGTPLTFVYKTKTATEEDITVDGKYLVWNNGSETVLTPTDDSGRTCFDYGANTTEENSYYVIVGDNVL